LDAGLELLRRRDVSHLRHACRALLRPIGPLRDRALLIAWLRRQGARDAADRLRLRISNDPQLRDRALRAWRRDFDRLGRELDGARWRRRHGDLLWRRALDRLEQRRQEAAAQPNARRLHRWRIAAKRARYLGEWLQRPRRELRRLATLQRQLGALHDLELRRRALRPGDLPAEVIARIEQRHAAMRRRALVLAARRRRN